MSSTLVTAIPLTNSLREFATTSNSTGAYTLTVATGAYKIKFEPQTFKNGEKYASQYFNSQSSWLSATTILITVPNTLSNINASVKLGKTLQGTIINQTTQQPFTGSVQVNIYTADNLKLFKTAFSFPNGKYFIFGVPEGRFKVQFESPGYFDDWYKRQNGFDTASEVLVPAQGLIPEINGLLFPCPFLSQNAYLPLVIKQ